MFLAKRGRPDIMTGINFLSTCVRNPTESDWKKFIKLISYLKNSTKMKLVLEVNGTRTLKWFIDSSFGVHPDMKSHTGSTFTLGKGSISSASTKQKVNSRSLTEAVLIAIDNKIAKVIWTKRFLNHQGYKLKASILYRDNTSTIKLTTNGKESCGKRTRHFDIEYFFITDLIERKEIEIEFFPSIDMMADFMTKPLTGSIFIQQRNNILNEL